jgi:catechol 2,3-dioxygenase-like lactoylglutathione lyase family enzyme
MTGTTFTHVNIIATDWRALSHFYQVVFGCMPVPPERKLSGAWLEAATGVLDAELEGEHLRLPGHGERGPTLEIFSYKTNLDRLPPAANRLGIGHLAFEVDDAHATLDAVLAHGGGALGQIQMADVRGKGKLTFVYATDPEGNILELQTWA